MASVELVDVGKSGGSIGVVVGPSLVHGAATRSGGLIVIEPHDHHALFAGATISVGRRQDEVPAIPPDGEPVRANAR